jgi:hypothetical protein
MLHSEMMFAADDRDGVNSDRRPTSIDCTSSKPDMAEGGARGWANRPPNGGARRRHCRLGSDEEAELKAIADVPRPMRPSAGHSAKIRTCRREGLGSLSVRGVRPGGNSYITEQDRCDNPGVVMRK